MLDISIPAGSLGFLADKITKALFFASYQVSHQEHLKRSQAGKHFDELGEFFEFDIHLECDHVSNATVPTSFLILRNRSDKIFERVELLVEADGGCVKYQDFATLISVGETPVVVYLPRIPLKEIEITENNRIVMSYEKVNITLFIRDKAVPEERARAVSWPISPTYTEFLNSSWDKKWGTVWNLDYIESCKTSLRHKLQFYLVTRNRWPVAGEPSSRIYRSYKIFRLLLGMPLFRIVSHEWIVSALFWLPIFVRYRKLGPRDDG